MPNIIKLLKDTVKESRGDAFWDGIKWVWALGGSTITALVLWFIQRVRANVDYVGAGVVFVISFLLILWAQSNKNSRSKTDIAKLTPGATTLPDLSMSPCKDPALHALAERDLRYVSDRVVNLSCLLRIGTTGLAYPWIEFKFAVLNVAVMPIRIGPQPTDGSVKCLGEIIPNAPQIIEGNNTYLPHGDRMAVVLRLSLTSEFARKINEHCPVGQHVEFDFTDLRIPILIEEMERGHWILDKCTFLVETPL